MVWPLLTSLPPAPNSQPHWTFLFLLLPQGLTKGPPSAAPTLAAPSQDRSGGLNGAAGTRGSGLWGLQFPVSYYKDPYALKYLQLILYSSA